MLRLIRKLRILGMQSLNKEGAQVAARGAVIFRAHGFFTVETSNVVTEIHGIGISAAEHKCQLHVHQEVERT